MSRACTQKFDMHASVKRRPPHVGTQVRRGPPNESSRDLDLLPLAPPGTLRHCTGRRRRALAHQRASSILCDEDGRDVDGRRCSVR